MSKAFSYVWKNNFRSYIKLFCSLLALWLLYEIFTHRQEILESASNLWDESPTFFGTIFTGLTGAIIAIISVLKQRKLSKEKNSLDFQTSYKHSEMVNKAWKELRKINYEDEGYVKKLGQDGCKDPLASSLSIIFNEWERCSNAIRSGVYDDDFLYSVYASTVLFLYREFHPYINARKDSNPKFFNNFVWLAAKWSIRREKELRKENPDEERHRASVIHVGIIHRIEQIEECNLRRRPKQKPQINNQTTNGNQKPRIRVMSSKEEGKSQAAP